MAETGAQAGRDILRRTAWAREELGWIAGTFPAEHVLWRPSPDGWNAHQTLTHLRDTEIHAYRLRVELVLTEGEPHLPDFPGGQWMAKWQPDGSLSDLADDYGRASRASEERLATISDTDWLRCGTHPNFGRLSLVGWVERMHFHLMDHMTQILNIRSQLRTNGLVVDR